MSLTHRFKNFTEACLAIVCARMNFNQQLADSTQDLEHESELLDYWTCIAPTFTKVIGTPADGIDKLQTLRNLGVSAASEAKYYQSLIDFLDHESIRSPKNTKEVTDALDSITIIYLKVFCKQYLLKYNEQEFKSSKLDEISEDIKHTKRKKGYHSLGFSKKDKKRLIAEYDSVNKESDNLADLVRLFHEFLGSFNLGLESIVDSIKPLRVLDHHQDQVQVAYYFDSSLYYKKFELAQMTLTKAFQQNRESYSTEQQKAYYQEAVALHQARDSAISKFNLPSGALLDPNDLETTRQIIKFHLDMVSLLAHIDKIEILLSNFDQKNAATRAKEAAEIHAKTKFVHDISQGMAKLVLDGTDAQHQTAHASKETKTDPLIEKVCHDPADGYISASPSSSVLSLSTDSLALSSEASDIEDAFTLDESVPEQETPEPILLRWQKPQPKSPKSLKPNTETDAQLWQEIAMQLKNVRDIFQDIFSGRAHLRYREEELMKIITVLGGTVQNRSGSRKRIQLNHVYSDTLSPYPELNDAKSVMVVHSPHGRKASSRDGKLPSFCVKNYVTVLRQAGFCPEKIWPEDYGMSSKAGSTPKRY